MELLEQLDLKLAAAFYQQRDGGLTEGIREITEEWTDWERRDLGEFIRRVLNHVPEEIIAQHMDDHFPWHLDDPVGWLKALAVRLSQ